MDRPDHPSSTAGLREEALSISNDPENWSMAMRFSRLPDHERQALLDDMSPAEQEALLWDWKFWARPKQIPPTECDDEMCSCGGNWRTLMVLAGRGFGKTRMGAEWVRERVEEGATRLNVVGATASDTRDIIVEGPSGIISVCPPWMGARYQPTKRRIIFEGMDDNPVVMCFSADEPDRLRGHQCEYAWVDELAAWRYEQEAWTQLMLGLRLGTFPRVIVTTTPRPTRTIKRLVRSPSTHMVTGSTYENWDNLAESFTEEIVAAYEGTRIGKQELYAIILDDSPGALWNRDLISDLRIGSDEVPDFRRVVVAIDPATTYDSEEGDETGIIVVALGDDDQGYVLEDLSGRMKPEEWSRTAIKAYHKWAADRIVAEINQGGDMVESVIRVHDPNIPYRGVRASRGKEIRAEPVSALYEQKKVHHVGIFDFLEDQMCTWQPGDKWSPDRLDALVWGLTDLMVTGTQSFVIPHIVADVDLVRGSHWREADKKIADHRTQIILPGE